MKPYLLIRVTEGGGAQLLDAFEEREEAQREAERENGTSEKGGLPWRAEVREAA